MKIPLILPRKRGFLFRALLIACLTLTLYVLCSRLPTCFPFHSLFSLRGFSKEGSSEEDRRRVERLDMSTGECRKAFPGLTREVEDAVRRGPFELRRMPGHATGLVQGRIGDGKVGLCSEGRGFLREKKAGMGIYDMMLTSGGVDSFM